MSALQGASSHPPDGWRAPSREIWLSGALAIVTGAIFIVVATPEDASVHLYRTFLVEHGTLVWDNLWYAGHYPLAGYSLLYYFLASAVGNLPLVFAGSVASAVLFASIVFRQWGELGLWPVRLFGVLAAAPMFTGLYSYSLGFAAVLSAVWALQRHRSALALICSAAALGFSPLAFLFLVMILAALWLVHRPINRTVAAVVIGLGAVVGVEGVILKLFPSGGTYPFHWADMLCLVALSALGYRVSERDVRARPIAMLFVLWAIGAVVFWLVPGAVGDNWARLRGVVFPLMLLSAVLVRFRPRRLVFTSLAAALAYNIVPYALQIPNWLNDKPAASRYWAPALTYLSQHADRVHRIEVVPTADHWEAYWIPKAGYPLARGWYRQLDKEVSPVLYDRHLSAAEYRRWLHTMAVSFVLLPSSRLDKNGGPTEKRLLMSGETGLAVVFRSRAWTIFEVPRPSGMIEGAHRAAVTEFSHRTIAGNVSASGDYLLRVRFTPYWALSSNVSCAHPRADGMTELVLTRPGTFTLSIPKKIDGLLKTPGFTEIVGRRSASEACRNR